MQIVISPSGSEPLWNFISTSNDDGRGIFKVSLPTVSSPSSNNSVSGVEDSICKTISIWKIINSKKCSRLNTNQRQFYKKQKPKSKIPFYKITINYYAV